MITKIDFINKCREQIQKSTDVVRSCSSINHYVLCCWVSPFDTFEKRVGYFEDYSEAAEFYSKFISKYSWCAHKMITNENGDQCFVWDD